MKQKNNIFRYIITVTLTLLSYKLLEKVFRFSYDLENGLFIVNIMTYFIVFIVLYITINFFIKKLMSVKII